MARRRGAGGRGLRQRLAPGALAPRGPEGPGAMPRRHPEGTPGPKPFFLVCLSNEKSYEESKIVLQNEIAPLVAAIVSLTLRQKRHDGRAYDWSRFAYKTRLHL